VNQHKIIQKLGVFVAILSLAILSCSSISEISSMFATETPTPTITYTPSPTFTPSPTATETQTPSPTPLPVGVKREEQPDGSTLFTDYDNRYQLTLPEGWTVIPLSSKDVAAILNDLSVENPSFKDLAETFKQLDPNVIRVIAINTDSKYVVNGFSTNLTITAVEDKIMAAMPLDFVTGALEESMTQQGATVLSSGNLAKNNANGVEVGTFDFEQTSPTAAGTNVQVRSRAIIFQVNDKVIMVQLATLQQFGEELLPVLDKVSDSITLLEP